MENDSASLPLPRPSSLPQRPPGPIAPVYIKKESAVLPQSMALPAIPPLGRAWEGEEALSGNERRRRGSVASTISSSGSFSAISSDGDAGGRPARLVKMGQRWRESVGKAKMD